MAVRLSTGLANALLTKVPTRSVATITGTDIAAVDGGGSADTFTQVAAGFVTAGFKIGDSIITIGWAGANAGSVGPFTLTNVTAGTLTVATGSIIASESATPAVTIVALNGGSFREIFHHGILRIYSGTQPATADTAASGTLLLEITSGSGAWTAGAVANGLCFAASATDGVISKDTTQVWSGVGLATNTAGWWRLYANPTDAGGLSTTHMRVDGAVATSGSEINMSSTSITTGATTTIDTFTITLPKA